MNPYTEYKLTHWEEPEHPQTIIAKDGYISVTPEFLVKQIESFFPVGYQEGEITIDVAVPALKRFWMSLGGEMERA